MLEAMAALILAIVGAVLMLMILAYGIYVTFYPLGRTVKGGMEAAKEQVEVARSRRLHGGNPLFRRV